MIAFLRKMCIMGVSVYAILSGEALAAGGGDLSKLVIVADTRGVSGWQAWLANLYNESHLYFTIFTVVTIPIVGLILGSLADLAMRQVGLDLKSRSLSEH